MDFLLKALANFVGNLLMGMVESMLSSVISQFQMFMEEFTTNGYVVAAHNTVLAISLSLIVLFCVKQYFDTYVMETSGDPDADPLDILIRGSQATAIATCSTWLFYTFMNFTTVFATDMIGNQEVEFTAHIKDVALALTANVTSGGFLWLLFLLAIVIGMFCFFIIAVIRALELSLQYIILPFFCVELTFASHERFNGLVTTIIVTGLYYTLQLIMFNMFANQFANTLTGISADNPMGTGAFITIGFLIVMLRSHRWLDKFVYTTGMGNAAMKGMSLGLTRFMFSKSIVSGRAPIKESNLPRG